MRSPVVQLRRKIRSLRRAPGFTALTIFTLAVGIGANATIFSVVNGVLLRPLPYPNEDRVMGVWHRAPGLDIPRLQQAEETYILYRERARSFQEIGLGDDFEGNLTGEGEPERVPVARVTSSLFAVLAVPPALGRTFSAEDDEPGGPELAVLSHGLWARRFGSDADVLGKTIEVNGVDREIIGVMPADFRDLYGNTQLWLPYRIDREALPSVSFSMEAVGRLAPGVTAERAEAELSRILPELPEAFPGGITSKMLEDARVSALVHPLREDIAGDMARVLWILLGVAGCVLLIACANVANLFMVRAEGRQRDIAVRTALGAERGEIIRYFLGDSVLLGLLGGVAGLVLAYIAVRGLVAFGPAELPRLEAIRVDSDVIMFTAVISVLAGLLFGAVPLLKYGRPDLVTSLKEGGRGGSAGRETHRIRNVLVAGQVALALLLLIGSGLMARSFWELRDVEPGFAREGVLTFRLSLPSASHPEPGDVSRFYELLRDRLGGLPGVETVGGSSAVPLAEGESNNALLLEDYPLEPGALPQVVRTVYADPGYFRALGIPLLAGRAFEPDDYRLLRRVAVVSASMARHYWPEGGAIGRRIAPGLGEDQRFDWYTVVGLVGDVHDTALDEPADEMVYYPTAGLDQAGDTFTVRTRTIALRSAGPPLALTRAVREAVWSLDPNLPVVNLRTTSMIVSRSMARTAFTMVLLAIAAAVALLLGTVGLYGVVSYVVSQRTREIGVRMAIGARPTDVRRMVVRQGLVVSGLGAAVGLVAAFALTRVMNALLFGVSATDPIIFVAVPIVLLATAAGAAYLPARRASGIDPMEALRYE